MPRRRDPDAAQVVHRTARVTLRPAAGQRRRLFGLLSSAGDLWACVLEANWWRRRRQAPPLVSYQALCRELAVAGPGTFGELDSVAARSVLRRYSDSWFTAAKRRKAGQESARFPRRRVLTCPHCRYAGHRDLSAAATIATRAPGGGPTIPIPPGVVTHRRAGRHLPGVVSARRDPRRRPPAAAGGSVGRPPARPTTHTGGEESLASRRGSTTHTPPGKR